MSKFAAWILSLAMVSPTMTILNLGMLIMVLMGVAVNGWMLWIAVQRNALIRRSGEAARDELAELVMRRAVRCESVYFAVQIVLLVISVRGLMNVVPLDPAIAVGFFFESMAGRAIVSGLILYLSVRDLKDRRRAAQELDRIHPETPASGVG